MSEREPLEDNNGHDEERREENRLALDVRVNVRKRDDDDSDTLWSRFGYWVVDTMNALAATTESTYELGGAPSEPLPAIDAEPVVFYDQDTEFDWRDLTDVSDEDSAPEVEAEGDDLSHGGMCIRIGKKLENGEVVEIEFAPEELERSITVEGQVRWTELAERVGGREVWKTGLQFQALDEAQRTLLEKLVQRRSDE